MPDLLFYLILGHIVGDFALQSDRVAACKGESARIMTWHVAVYCVCIAAALWAGLYHDASYSFWSSTTLLVLLGLFAQHWTQDYLKVRRFNGSKQAFFVDQALHLTMLYLIRIFVYHD